MTSISATSSDFSSQEVFHLRIGTKKHGLAFQKILDCYQFAPGRTAQQLAEKWADLSGSKTGIPGKHIPFKTTKNGMAPPESTPVSVLQHQRKRVASILGERLPIREGESENGFRQPTATIPVRGKRQRDLSPHGSHPLDVQSPRKADGLTTSKTSSVVLASLGDTDDVNPIYDQMVDAGNSSGSVATSPSLKPGRNCHWGLQVAEKNSIQRLLEPAMSSPQETCQAMPDVSSAPLSRGHRQSDDFAVHRVVDELCRELQKHSVNLRSSASSDSSFGSSSDDDNSDQEDSTLMRDVETQHVRRWAATQFNDHVEHLGRLQGTTIANVWRILSHSLPSSVRVLVDSGLRRLSDFTFLATKKQQAYDNAIIEDDTKVNTWRVLIDEVNAAASDDDLERVLPSLRCAIKLAATGETLIMRAFHDSQQNALKFVRETWSRWYPAGLVQDGNARELLCVLLNLIQTLRADESFRIALFDGESTPDSLRLALRRLRRTGPASSWDPR